MLTSAWKCPPLVGRLLTERLDDGGWNCETISGSVRSSFGTTINVLEGLLEVERATGGTPESRAARRSGEEYLLERALFDRLGTGEPADERFLNFLHPNRWHYGVLRALDYFTLCRRPHQRGSRPPARGGNRARPLPAPGGRHLAPRLEPDGAGVVRRRRRQG